eukprot:gene13295-13407_t
MLPRQVPAQAIILELHGLLRIIDIANKAEQATELNLNESLSRAPGSNQLIFVAAQADSEQTWIFPASFSFDYWDYVFIAIGIEQIDTDDAVNIAAAETVRQRELCMKIDGNTIAFFQFNFQYATYKERGIFSNETMNHPENRYHRCFHSKHESRQKTARFSLEERHKIVAGGVVHSFTGSIEEMLSLVDLGFYIGINGCSLKTEENLRMAAAVPLERLLLETDAPWCGIKPTHAGFKHLDRNEPCTLIQIVKMQSAYDKWLVLANDQTFVIVPNLIQFLAHYDAEELVYTGNELAIGMGSAAVHFASGGAGAFDFLTAALDSPFQAGSNLSSGGCCSTSGGYSFRDGKKGHPKLVELSATVCGDCALQEVFHWSTRARMDADYSCVVNITLSEKTAVVLLPSKRSKQQKSAFLLDLYQAGRPVIRVDSEALQRSCISRSKWSIDNPGIVLSLCLTVALKIPFASSRPPLSPSFIKALGWPPSVELFNVYGPVRMALNDIDDWYVKAKALATKSISNVRSSDIDLNEIVSFHYVNQMESVLLYNLLAGESEVPLSEVSFRDIRRMWPSTNSEAGPYSRRLISDEEAIKLVTFLKSIRVHKC